MTPADSPMATAEQVELLVQLTRARYVVALLLLWGLVAVALGTVALACGWRKLGFLLLGVYGTLMTFIGVGLCYLFGPAVLIAALGGILAEWIREGRPPGPAAPGR